MAENSVIRYMLASKLFRVSVVLIVVMAFVFILIYRWSSAPVTTVVMPQDNQSNQQMHSGYQELRTRYLVTSVPASWRIRDRSTDDKTVQVVAFGSGNPKGQVAIVSAVLPQEGLPGVSDYNLRVKSNSYSRVSDPSLPAGSIVFAGDDQTPSYTAFLQHNDRYASITTSATVTVEVGLQLLSHVIDALSWLD